MLFVFFYYRFCLIQLFVSFNDHFVIVPNKVFVYKHSLEVILQKYLTIHHIKYNIKKKPAYIYSSMKSFWCHFNSNVIKFY